MLGVMRAKLRMLGSAAVAIAVGLTLVACAAAPTGGAGLPTVGPHQVDVDWDNPIPAGIPWDNAKQDGSDWLPFTPIAPKNLGEPIQIVASDPNVVPRPVRVIAFLYNTPGGRVVVKEHVPDVAPQTYLQAQRDLLNDNSSPTIGGHFEIVFIRGGEQALITIGTSGEAALFWLEEGKEIIVRGPYLTRSTILDIASGI
ncbi:MAG: hypothetical protein ACXVP8_00735 [Actinomycetota bacterium]